MSRNALQGTLPLALYTNLSALQTLSVFLNQLSGTLPGDDLPLSPFDTGSAGLPAWVYSKSLTTLRLDSNLLVGTLPAWLNAINRVPLYLGIASNLFSATGELPAVLVTPVDQQGHNFHGRSVSLPPVTVCSPGQHTTGVITARPCAGQVDPQQLTSPPIRRTQAAPVGSFDFPAANCTPCAVGTFSRSPGQFSCELCPDGFRSSADFTSCVACAAGTAQLANKLCAPCAANTFSALGATACTPCAAGSSSPPGSSVCAPCPAGSFFNFSAGGCSPCAAGTHADAPGSASCVSCPQSTYSDTPGASICSGCPVGSTGPSSSASLAGCLCALGNFSLYAADGSSFLCSPCPRGAYCDPTQSAVPLAQANYWHLPGDYTTFYVRLRLLGRLWLGTRAPSLTRPQACMAGYCVREEPTSLTGQLISTVDGTLVKAYVGTPLANSVLGYNASGNYTVTSSSSSSSGPLNLPAQHNCRPGHHGSVCGDCITSETEVWAQSGQFCKPCQMGESFLQWPYAKRVAVSAACIAAALIATLPYLLFPLFPEAKAKARHTLQQLKQLAWAKKAAREADEPGPAAAARLSRRDWVRKVAFPRVWRLGEFMLEPVFITIETYQIVSACPGCRPGPHALLLLTRRPAVAASFKETIRVPWPRLFTDIVAWAAVVNFRFTQLPKTACVRLRRVLVPNVHLTQPPAGDIRLHVLPGVRRRDVGLLLHAAVRTAGMGRRPGLRALGQAGRGRRANV